MQLNLSTHYEQFRKKLVYKEFTKSAKWTHYSVLHPKRYSTLLGENPSIEGVAKKAIYLKQGDFNNCFLISGMRGGLSKPANVAKILKLDEVEATPGKVCLYFRDGLKWKKYILEPELVSYRNKTIYSNICHDCYFFCFVEVGVAWFFKNFRKMNLGGFFNEALYHTVDGFGQTLWMEDLSDIEAIELLFNASKNSKLVGLSSKPKENAEDENEEQLFEALLDQPPNELEEDFDMPLQNENIMEEDIPAADEDGDSLVSYHSYFLIGPMEVEDVWGQKHMIFILRNPHGIKEFGSVYPGVDFWKELLPKYQRILLRHLDEEGVLIHKMRVLRKRFYRIQIYTPAPTIPLDIVYNKPTTLFIGQEPCTTIYDVGKWIPGYLPKPYYFQVEAGNRADIAVTFSQPERRQEGLQHLSTGIKVFKIGLGESPLASDLKSRLPYSQNERLPLVETSLTLKLEPQATVARYAVMPIVVPKQVTKYVYCTYIYLNPKEEIQIGEQLKFELEASLASSHED